MASVRGFTGNSSVTQIPEPPIARFLFSDTRMAWLWLVVRVYVGYQWVQAGLEKLENPAWVGAQAGTGMAGFAKGALAKTTGAHADVAGWYGSFLQNVVLPNATMWSYMITFGEILVGLGLIFGCLTGVAAFFGSFMSANFLFAGTVSINPMMFVLASWLVLSWRVAGYFGLDYFVLPLLGTPWAPGRIVARRLVPVRAMAGASE